MKKVLYLLAFTGSYWFLGFQLPKKTTESVPPTKPNIVLIMADDLGFSDIGCYGSEIKTPNLDKLASEGMRLKQCYNNGICAPSRATLLTGQYPHKAGMGFFNQDLGIPAYQGFLNKQSLTFGEVFKQAGYSTYLSGKWHVGNDSSKWALERGFDKFFGFISGASSFFDSKPVNKGANDYFVNGNQKYYPPKDFYLTDELTKRGIDFLKQNKKDNPFLLYMAYSAPHWPLHAKPQDISKYKGKYNMGWDSLRVLRHQKQVALGIVDKNHKPSKDTSLPAWHKLSYDERQYWVKKMEVYAAMVDNLDQNIGQLVQYLKDTKQLDNTLIVFVSDNGAEGWDFSKMGMALQRNTGMVGTANSNESYTKNWSQVSTMPLRSYKGTPFEGGISTPFIARFPSVIPANTLKEGVVHFVDFMPTFLDFARIDYPKTYKDMPVNPLAGENFTELLRGGSWQRNQPIFYEWSGHRVVRKGKWKLMSTYPENQWALYDMDNDRTETTNIAKENPKIVAELNIDYWAWAKQNDVVEWNADLQKKAGIPTNNQ
jgi:arylsulfatase A-like enzyme